MQVLGDLVKLPDNNDLPLPWWHRASLGLQSKTWCYVALITSHKRQLPDVIVSVLNPYNYQRIVRVRSTQPDEPGVVTRVISGVTDLNIALAESATLETGGLHEVTLVCEPKDRAASVPSDDELRARYQGAQTEIHRYRALPVEWMDRGEVVEGGWIRSVRWRDHLLKKIDPKRTSGTDLGKAVVSADTTNRLLRFVFPLKGARTIRIRHLDHPGILKEITDVLVRHDFNILSMLLRRGGARPGQAVLVAVCEPRSANGADDSYEAMRRELESLPGDLEVFVRLDEGIDCKECIAPKEPWTVVARIPTDLIQRVREIRSGIPKGKLAVFFSHRFVEDRGAVTYAEHLRAALIAHNCHVLEVSGRDDVRGARLIFREVSAHLWAAEAGIILISNIKDPDPIGRNIPHEYGFLQGQAKPILLLVQRGLDEAINRWTNTGGVYAPRFPSDEQAFAQDSPHSIYGLVREFVERVREQSGHPSAPILGGLET
jgi:hypothetical protein